MVTPIRLEEDFVIGKYLKDKSHFKNKAALK